jgi:hypothetical protein
MARIYETQDYGDLFESHARSREFNPVASYDPSNQIQQRTQQKLNDIQMLARGALRQYELDQMFLQAEGNKGARSLSLSSTQSTSTTQTFNSLLGLSNLASKTYATINEQANSYRADQQLMASVGFGIDPNIKLTPEQQQIETEKQVAIKADSKAASEVATELKQEGTLEGQGVAHALQQTTVYNSLKGAENNTFAAIGAYPAFLAEFRNATPADKLPKTTAETQAYLIEANRLFFRMTGMNEASHADKVQLARSMAGTGQNFLLQQVSQSIKIEKDENLADAKAYVSTVVDAHGTADGVTAQEAWNRTSTRYLLGNVGYNDNPRGGNRAALENLLQEAVDQKNSKFLEELAIVEKVPGNKGTRLGKEYDDMFDKYRRQLRQQAVQDFNLGEAEDRVEVGTIMRRYMEDPTKPGARRQTIEALYANGSEDALKTAQSLLEKGFNYDPTKALELEEMRANGRPIDQDQLDAMQRQGIISGDEYKRYSTRGPAGKADKDVDKFLKTLSAGYKAAMQGNAPATGLTQEVKLQLISRHQLFMDELKQSVMMEVGVNSNLANDNAALSKLVEQKAAVLIKQPHYQLKNDPEKGWGFSGDLTPTRNLIKANRGTYYDFSSLPAEKLFGPKISIPRSQVSLGRDRFITYDSLRSDVRQVLGGKDASNNTRLIAKKFGVSTPAFVDQQLKAYGLPSLSSLRSTPDGQSLMPSADGDIPNATHGMRLLRSFGFPKRSAAYLAGNIQQESGFTGRREWYSPMNDGSGRNGGLISWNQGRIQALERYYGRNIKEISEIEQLTYMISEMRSSYKGAYRIFMNPNSSESELRRASYLYWGYGHEGNRYAYAKSLDKYGRI